MLEVQPNSITQQSSDLVQKERDYLFSKVTYLKPEDIQLLQKAFKMAKNAHEGQTRQSGEPYIIHPIAVTTQLAEWKLDVQGLVAAILHDVLEDTEVSKITLTEQFGKNVADLVDGLSKLRRLEYESQEAEQAENFRKMVLATANDLRVIIIKLSDRLHNMRTLGHMRVDKQRRIARETMEIYAPIANRIGLNQVYRELQDLAFKYLHPNRYTVIAKAMKAARGNQRGIVNKILQNVRGRLSEWGIRAETSGREKNLYSIYKKMSEKKLSFSEVLDIFGLRIIVDDVPTCYLVIGALHSLYKPLPGKFKDYIAIPKGNSYQSLHTALFGPNGVPVEAQVRTHGMHTIAESGIASHWMYKSADTSMDVATQRTHQWLQNVLAIQASSTNAVEFLEQIKIDLFPDEVYVFTPKGKILVLPEGSTPIDFAYAVHTDIGCHCIAARVNFVLVPLRTPLHNGDTVEIITSPQSKPNPSWLSFVVSARARTGIRSYLKGLHREEAAMLGEKLLRQAFTAYSSEPLKLTDSMKSAYLSGSPEKQTEFIDVLVDIGIGKILPVVAARRLVALTDSPAEDAFHVRPMPIRGNGMVQMALCCNPIPGDEIVGVVVQDKGLIIHRKTCQNCVHIDNGKLVPVAWEPQKDRTFSVLIDILIRNERGVIAEIATAISRESVNIETVDTLNNHKTDGLLEIHFHLQVVNLEHLERVLTQIVKIGSVIYAKRV